MMNLTSKTSKSFLLFKRALVLLCFVLCSLIANAGGNLGGYYTVKVAPSQEPKTSGAGKVYLSADWNMTANNSSKYSETIEVSAELTATSDQMDLQNKAESQGTTGWSQDIYISCTNVKLRAESEPGSSFEGWKYGTTTTDRTQTTLSLSNKDPYKKTSPGNEENNEFSPNTSIVYYPIFIARTYEAYGQSIGIITLDAEGNVSAEEVGGSVSTDGTNWSATAIAGGNIVTQSADDQGKQAKATFLPRFYAKPNAGYEFKGWATTPEESADIYTQKTANPYQTEVVSTAEQGKGATPPSLGGFYAVFAPSVYYYHLGPVVGIAGDPNEWAAKGRVYADNGEAVTTGVAENQWQISIQDETVYSEENEKVYTYTYYAKVLEPTKVAFKGWTTSPNGEPSYFDNPLKEYPHTMTDENTSELKPYRTPTLYAVFESFYYKTPAVAVANNSKGAGFVNVSLTEGLSLDLCTKEEIAASTETHQVPATGTSYAYKVAYYAKNKPGTRFEYWSSTPDGSNIVSREAIYVEDYETSATDANFPHVAPALYAVFSSDIDIRQQDRMIVYIDDEGNGNINDSKVLIDFQKGNTLTATLTGDDASSFTLSNRSGSKSGNSITFDATQGLIELVVAYEGDLNAAIGKVANITLSATSGGQDIERPVTIVVEEAPIITFLPTDGKGAYKVSMTNGSGINYTMNAATKENIKVPITHESMSNIEIALQSDVDTDDYYFFGWQMIDGNDVTYLSYEQLFTYQFTRPVTVRADFVHKDIATYYIVDDPTNTQYHDFALVMRDAKKLQAVNGTQTVMLNDKVRGAQVTKAILPKGNYTIPTGVRFIVPGKTVRTYREALEQSDYNSSISSFSEYIRWIVEEGTTITVEGGASVSVLANVAVNGASNANGLPYDYGHIELNQNCRMEFLGDSRLFAYGYVTGPESSAILMKDQSLVKELLQFYDWRGGTATMFGLGTFRDNKIFIINQYFVQNIEAPLTITSGVTEKLDVGLNASGIVNLELTFISQNAGFFQLSNGYSITKYYDKYSDRLKIFVDNKEGKAGSAELGSMSLDITGIGKINSAEFVLPLPHNYDIVLGKNTVTNVLHDMALLPGATCHIMEGATCNLGVSSTANFFIYDQKYSTVDGKGYLGSTDKEFFYIASRPDGRQYTRNSASIQDAQLIVDGILNTPKGYLYTTNYKTETSDHACITSNGGGKVQFNALGTKPDTKQGTHQKYGINVVSIPVAPARLLHGDGTYQEPSANTTYTYINDRWTANTAETEKPEAPVAISRVPVFTVTNYTTSSYVGKSSTGTTTISTNNTNVNWTSTSLTWSSTLYGEHANQFRCTLGAKSSTAVPVTIIFEPKSDGVKTATLRVTATYTYKDTYGVTGKYVYSKDIHLTGNASYLAANTLAFADLSTLYKGQSGVALFTTGNNTQPITITANPTSAVTITGNTAAATIAGNTIGKVTLTATQEADLTNNIAATTITKTIEVNDPVQWNWDILYLGEQYDTPITMLDGTTGWTLTEAKDEFNIIDFQGSAPNYTASVANLIAGAFKIDFTFTQNGQSRPFTSHVIVDPRHLRVDVNNDTVFRAVTLSANENVDFRGKQVTFTSTIQSISQWKLGFFGVPDKMCFIPNGSNTWQIEESSNGVNWTTSFPWKKLPTNVPFEWSLIPSTRYVRISYGAGNVNPTTKVNNATLNEFYITELTDVKADQNKLYMPVEEILPATDPKTYKSVTKEVVLTYANVSKIGVTVRALDSRYDGFFSIKDADGNPTDSYNWTSLPEFGVMGLEVICHPTVEAEVEGVIDVFADGKQVLQIPIQTYLFPQELPIKLATDKPDGGDRYYFVTTHTHNAEWDGTDGVRTITLQNAVSDAAPYLTFAFKGAPTYISFNYPTTAQGTWEIEESVDGKSWTVVVPKEGDAMADGYLKRTVTATSQYLKVIYESPYAEKVEITNLVIVGDASVVVPARMELDYKVPKLLTVSAINLPSMTLTTDNSNFQVTHGTDNGTYTDPLNPSLTLTSSDYPAALGENKMGNVPIYVKWTGSNAIEYATLTITNPNDNNKVLGVVELVGMKSSITDGEINISTGVVPGYTLNGSFDENGQKHRPVDIKAAFSEAGTAHFDYVVVYGETTTDDGSKTITTPNTMVGSNAKTPCYIYKKNGNAYELKKVIENTNSKDKAWYLTDMLDVNGEEQVTDPLDMDAVQIPNGKESVRMYITGFCPYASTGYTKADEGVWYFRANGGQSIDIYLEDCYIYSRSKTADGHAFIDRQDGYSFSERFVCGTGAVFVFACNETANATSMNVTIHTLDSNLVKSHYGCFLQSIAGRAYQASSPVQIRVLDDTYVNASKTTLNFTDEWLVSKNPKTATRTNGFVSLQKQVNNAPSIDMGNKNTVVNFNGGQVELQNAQIVSTNYKSSLAICPRSGEFAGVLLAYGMGTDDVRGTVYFNDGTTTVLPMYVSPNFAESYLLDKDANGSYITNSKGEFRTSCLRTPTNTFVTGGSHCMMRACKDPSSQGGAPKDKLNGTPLGLYKYPSAPWTETVDGNTVTHKGGWAPNGSNGLVTPTAGNVPTNYKVESVTPNNNGTKDNVNDDFLNFWFDPDFESAAQPEVDRTKSFWKTCMTRIEADYGGYGGAVGGPTEIAMAGDVQDEIVKYLLYCKIDENILSVLKDETYQAPVKNPAPSGDNYVPVHPSKVEGTEYFISNKDTFRVNEKIYYITTATADVWNAFTAPFDVENIYIMETYPENELEEMEWKGKKNRSDILMEQAKHNADFAAFFAVTIALGQEKTFETIYREYMTWADLQDETLGLKAKNDYTRRGMKPLTPYNGSNWQEADFYLNENAGEWLLTADDGYFETQWIIPDLSDGTLMEQGKTYSMLLPFCTGCVDYEIQKDANGNPVKDEDGNLVFKLDAYGNKTPLARDYWDYWSGKFLIFESTYAGPVELPTGEVVDGPGHTIYGSDYVESLAESQDYIESSAVLTGNCSFADLQTMNEELFTYSPDIKHSTFSPIELPVDGLGNPQPLSIVPTESFLVADIPTPAGVKVRGVSRTGEIIYDKENTPTDNNHGGNIPTVGGGNDLFITSTVEGINIAVAEPQQVRVMSATGATLFSGMVQTAVDVFLPTAGVYVITGENEVHKILH